MSKKQLLVSFVIIIVTVLLVSSCASSKNCEGEMKYESGTIAVVGNEPFTELALQVEGGESFILICDKELSEKLMRQQGQQYKIGYCKIEKKSRGTGLIVVKAEPITSGK